MKDQMASRAKALLGTASLLAASAGLSGCLNINTGFSGVPLDELDTSGSAPNGIALAGPDNLILTVGDTLDIQVEGDPDAIEGLRFDMDGDTLEIGRDSDWMSTSGKAIVRVTMPAPRSVSLAGSGDIDAATLAENAEISIAGSGSVQIGEIASDDLDISVAGSGSLSGSGTINTLEISIAGSGDIDFAKVKADDVEISIAGSGDIALASDGTVDASIAGSGDVNVTGNATCNSSALGSGSVVCKPAAASTPKSADASSDEGEVETK